MYKTLNNYEHNFERIRNVRLISIFPRINPFEIIRHPSLYRHFSIVQAHSRTHNHLVILHSCDDCFSSCCCCLYCRAWLVQAVVINNLCVRKHVFVQITMLRSRHNCEFSPLSQFSGNYKHVLCCYSITRPISTIFLLPENHTYETYFSL